MRVRASDIVDLKYKSIQNLESDIQKAAKQGYEKHVKACLTEIKLLQEEIKILEQDLNNSYPHKCRRSSNDTSFCA